MRFRAENGAVLKAYLHPRHQHCTDEAQKAETVLSADSSGLSRRCLGSEKNAVIKLIHSNPHFKHKKNSCIPIKTYLNLTIYIYIFNNMHFLSTSTKIILIQQKYLLKFNQK